MYDCNQYDSHATPAVTYDGGAAVLPHEQYGVSMPSMEESPWEQASGSVSASYTFNPVSYTPHPQENYQGLSPDFLSEAIQAELNELDSR